MGAFGRNHARVYRQLQQAGSVRLVGVVDPDTARADAVAREFGCKSFGSVEQMLTTHSEVQAASVAVPTVQHLEVARALMEAGVDVLIEKPMAATLEEADEMLRLAAEHKRVAQVGHLERFNPAVRATLPLIKRPMFFEVHRLSVFSPRALDVDVVLDLMIHDLDIVLTFVKSGVKEIRAVGLPILSGKVDIANVRIEFESGCVANFTASRVSTERVRKLRFFQAGQYISIDYGRQDVLVFSVEKIRRLPPSAKTRKDGAPSRTPEGTQPNCHKAPADGESADPDDEAGDHSGGAAAGGDQGILAGGAAPVASGGFAGGWAESAGARAGDSGGNCAARGTDRDGALFPEVKEPAANSEFAQIAGSCRAALGLDGRGRPSLH